MKKDYSALIWGIGFIILGIIFAGNTLNLWSIDVFFPGWWTLFLIVPGLVSMIKYGFNWGSGILVIVGIILLFDRLDIISGAIMWKLVVPLVLVIIGISIISSFFKGNSKKKALIWNLVKVNLISMTL
ncbi:LiaF transmembrane domain-containing protein [Clostridium celatum]|uniref:LiaF transmembrane domain-containing protein n=1 Tax=Clostridium celatum TaxID=36834 RepID=UPI00319DD9DF